MNDLQKTNNYGKTDTAIAREISQVQGQILMAKRFPRNEKQAIERIKNACTRPGLANVSVYQYTKGGANVSGASIRLAEALAQNWGNIDFGIKELDQNDNESVVEAYAWDLETNTRQTKTFVVKHERHTKKGIKKLTVPQDIYELIANQGARRVRACLLSVIPGDIAEMAITECNRTLEATADVSPKGIKKIVKAFASLGVTKKQIEEFIGRNIESITPALMLRLINIGNSIKDGLSSPEDWFAKEMKKDEPLKIEEPEKKQKVEPKQEPEKQVIEVETEKVEAETEEMEF